MGETVQLPASDHVAIEALIRRFADLNDRGDYEALAALFVADARFARPTAPDAPIVGRDAILASFRARPPRLSQHLTCNTLVTPETEDRARVRTVSVLIVRLEDGSGTLSIGTFADIVVREADGWRFAERVGGTVMDGLKLAAG